MRAFFVLLLWCASAFAQSSTLPARRDSATAVETPRPEVKPEDKCTLEGTVVSGIGGEPLKKAHLNLRPIGQQDAASYGADTDAAGHFTFTDVDPGRYSFNAARNGFVNQSYSPQGDLKRSTPLTLGSGQKLKDIIFKMTPQGVIAGRILDQDGDPIPRVQVQCQTFGYPRGKKQLVPGGMASTNDLGEFRIFGLRPGKYVIGATYQSQNAYQASTERAAGPAQPEEGFQTTYYSNTTNPDSASLVEVTPGAQIQGMSITLVRTRTVRIQGRVTSAGAQNQSRRNVMLMLLPRNTNSFLLRNTARVIDAKGNFEMRGVAPGSYYIWGNSMDEDQRYSARVPIEVGDSNIEGVEVNFQPPATINGHLLVEDSGELKGANVNVYLRPKAEGPMMGGAGGAVKDDLTFRLTNVTPDPYDINVFGLPEGFYLKSIRFGDQDVTLTGLDFTHAVPAGEITVVLNPNGGQIEGTVQNAKGENAIGSTITLIPAAERAASWLYKTANTDQNGHFTIKGVRPGEYKIYAWEEIENGAYQDPEYIKPHESTGKAVSVKDTGHENVQLTAIPAETAQR